jgi:hypothetical protein
MKGIRKSLFVLPFAAMIMVAGCSSSGNPPAGTSTDPVPVPTETVTAPPATVTETVTKPALTVTETAKPITVTPRPTPVPEDCSQTLKGWNNWGPKGTGEDYVAESNEVVSVGVGQHACFDQVTINIKTTSPVGSHFEYTDNPMSAGSGHSPNPPIAGGAVLQGSVFAPGYNLRESGAPFEYGPDYFTGWKALREVRFDVSFEGQTSFYIGVFQNNAFRMRSWQDGDVRRIIIQIAH